MSQELQRADLGLWRGEEVTLANPKGSIALLWYHCQSPGGHFYFISCPAEESGTLSFTFRG